jgi:hypothetical protein
MLDEKSTGVENERSARRVAPLPEPGNWCCHTCDKRPNATRRDGGDRVERDAHIRKNFYSAPGHQANVPKSGPSPAIGPRSHMREGSCKNHTVNVSTGERGLSHM